jgi:WD40 repeat protein
MTELLGSLGEMAVDEGEAAMWKKRALESEAAVLRLQKRVAELESENDLLALANADLRGGGGGGGGGGDEGTPGAPERDAGDGFEALRVHGERDALRRFPDASIFGACEGANVVACALRPGQGREAAGGWAGTWDVACAGADGAVRLYGDAAGHWSSCDAAAAARTTACGSPAICLAWEPTHGERLAAGCMDGSLRLLDVPLGHCDVAGARRVKDHEKRVVCLSWSRDGRCLATCARDKSVVIYAASAPHGGQLAKKHTFVLPTNPESLCFAGDTLIVAAREEPFMRHVDLHTLAETRVSKNRSAWDTHVSFEALHLAASPDGKYLAAATDQHKHVVYPMGTNAHARVLTGHSADEYANARVGWLGDGAASLVSNSADPALFQWDFASGKLLTKIDRAHEQGIRNLDAAVSGDKLATCSFDKSVKLWSAAPHGLGGAEGQ